MGQQASSAVLFHFFLYAHPTDTLPSASRMSRESLEGEEAVDHPLFLPLLCPHFQPELLANRGKEHSGRGCAMVVGLLCVFE